MKTALLAAAAGLVVAAFALPASALPGTTKAPGIESSILTPVADGCGPRRYWSRRFRRCVHY